MLHPSKHPGVSPPLVLINLSSSANCSIGSFRSKVSAEQILPPSSAARTSLIVASLSSGTSISSSSTAAPFKAPSPKASSFLFCAEFLGLWLREGVVASTSRTWKSSSISSSFSSAVSSSSSFVSSTGGGGGGVFIVTTSFFLFFKDDGEEEGPLLVKAFVFGFPSSRFPSSSSSSPFSRVVVV